MIIYVTGHIDTSSVRAMEEDIIQQLADVEKNAMIELDCAGLEYISSSGLRVILKLKKQHPNLCITNASHDVYNTFEMTGFTRIINVSKALRRVSIAGCEEIGRGGVGVVYRLDTETIIKVFRPGSPIDDPERERLMAKESFVLGMPTAIPFDLVWVEEANSYGLVFELINAGSMASAIKAHPERVEHYARIFGNTLRDMHEIHVPAGSLPLASKIHKDALQRIAHYFTTEQVELMDHILDMIPYGDSLLHCDCHPKNIMLTADEEPLLIDMGEVCNGHPLYDLSHSYSALHIEDNFEDFVGFPKALAETFWHTMLKAYFRTDDEAELDRLNELISAVGLLRSFMWISVAEFPEAVTSEVRRNADRLLLPQRDRLLNIANKLTTFTFI